MGKDVITSLALSTNENNINIADYGAADSLTYLSTPPPLQTVKNRDSEFTMYRLPESSSYCTAEVQSTEEHYRATSNNTKAVNVWQENQLQGVKSGTYETILEAL